MPCPAQVWGWTGAKVAHRRGSRRRSTAPAAEIGWLKKYGKGSSAFHSFLFLSFRVLNLYTPGLSFAQFEGCRRRRRPRLTRGYGAFFLY